VFAHGWNANWSYLVWGVVALAYGFLACGRPLRQKVVIALVAIPVVIFGMHFAMDLAGFRPFIDWI
jgi:hypothetical protein